MTDDTGWIRDGRNSLERFDPELVRRELTIIRDDPHCSAVQIVGGGHDRRALLPLTQLWPGAVGATSPVDRWIEIPAALSSK